MKRRRQKAHGRRLSPLAAAALGLLLAGTLLHCTEPVLPDPITRDPVIGYLATLGDIPLFRARETQSLPEEFYDTNGVRAPHVVQDATFPSTFLMYYEGLDSTTVNVSAGIGVASSTDNGFTFGDRRLLLVRRNRVAGDLGSLTTPNPLPPRLDDSFDSIGVQDPMVLQNCPFTSPPGGDCLFYSGPGIYGEATDDEQDGLKEGLGNSIVQPPDPPSRAIPDTPSGISMVAVPPTGAVAANAVPLLLANKEIDEQTPPGVCVGTDLSGGQLPCDADDFYTEIAPSFDPTEEVCDRRSFTSAEFNASTPADLNNDGTGLGIEAGPYPWESGGVGAPYVIEDPFQAGRYLMYYTCLEEFGERNAVQLCEERLVGRICVAELTTVPANPGVGQPFQVVARRLIQQPGLGDVNYATPSAPNTPLPNNVVVQGGNFVDQNSFDQSGVSDPTVLISRSVLGTILWRMWYTGKDENNAERIGIAGSFDGFDWDADDAALRVSTLVPSNPILVQAGKATAPTAFFPTDQVLRVYYESTTNGTEPSVNLATIVDLFDDVPPIVEFDEPSGADLTQDQGCDINFALSFEDAGGSGIDQQSFQIRFTDIRVNFVSQPAVQLQAQNDITLEDITVAQNSDWSDQWPSFRFGSSDSATVELQLNQFRLNPTLNAGQTAELDLQVIIFDRNDNISQASLTLTLNEAGTPTVCN